MKAKLLAVGILVPAIAVRAQSAPDYPITIHAQSAEIFRLCGAESCWELRLHVTIDGKKYSLQEEHGRKDLLRVGDYHAKIAKDETKHAYEYSREYEILMPDGDKRKYLVISESE